MPDRFWLPSVVALAATLGAGAAAAQNFSIDEMIDVHGALTQTLALTPVQKSAIYSAIVRQRGRAATPSIEPALGVSVPWAAELPALPNAAGYDPTFLKYAMVGDDVVIVDSVLMRVVDIIHGSARP